MAKRTPLYNWHIAHQARMVSFAGWDMPVQYSAGGILAEHEQTRTKASLFDICHMGEFVVQTGRIPLSAKRATLPFYAKGTARTRLAEC